MSLEICLFGTMEIAVRGRPAPRTRTRKEQWLLAYLILHRGRDHERERIAALLWPDSPEPAARQNLRRSLMNLRDVLGAESHRLLSPTARSLRLDLEGATIDVLSFDAALQRGDWATAVALYRGPMLEGCDAEWLLPERETRRQAYLAALERLADDDGEQGRYGEAARRLYTLLRLDPTRESAACRLMQALAAQGDHAAVAQVYQQLRRRLHQEFHLAPAEATTRLYQALRRSAPATPAPAAPPRAPRRRLPVPLTPLVGRRDEIAAGENALRTNRLVTLTGTGGVGKTRLAIAIAERAQERFPDGVWFVDLAPLTDDVLVLRAIATALEAPEEPDHPLERTLIRFLETRSLLLLLDNAEHRIEAVAACVSALLSHCPGLYALTTSRQPLHVSGERLLRVPPLSVPSAAEIARGEKDRTSALREYAAVQLFLSCAAAADDRFRLTPRNGSAVASLCRRLDGIPLAIELAASQVGPLSVAEIDARLSERLDLPDAVRRGVQPRQRTLPALIDWSYNLLSPREQALLRRLSVFAGGWTWDAAQAVCQEDAPETLRRLVDQSLVVFDSQQEDAGRYGLLEAIRQYALDRLEEAGERDRCLERHRDYFLAFAQETEPQLVGPDQTKWLERLEAERDNLRTALRHCLTAPAGGNASLRLTRALLPFWDIRGYFAEGRQWLEAALSRPDAQAPTPERARALAGAGFLARRQNAYVAARAYYEESLALFQSFGDLLGVSRAVGNLGLIAYEQGEYAAARRQIEEALQIVRAHGTRRSLATWLHSLALIEGDQGNVARAHALYDECLALFRQIEDHRSIAAALHSLGCLVRQQGDYERGRALSEESLAICRAIGHSLGIASALNALANVAQESGDLARARALYEEELAIEQEMGERAGVALTQVNLGTIALWQGDPEQARALVEEGLASLRSLRSLRYVAHALSARSEIATARGEFDRARTCLDESLVLRQELGDRRGVAQCLEGFAELAHVQGHLLEAVRLWGAADALREAIACLLPPNARQKLAARTASVRAILGDEAFEKARAEGRERKY